MSVLLLNSGSYTEPLDELDAYVKDRSSDTTMLMLKVCVCSKGAAGFYVMIMHP